MNHLSLGMSQPPELLGPRQAALLPLRGVSVFSGQAEYHHFFSKPHTSFRFLWPSALQHIPGQKHEMVSAAGILSLSIARGYLGPIRSGHPAPLASCMSAQERRKFLCCPSALGLGLCLREITEEAGRGPSDSSSRQFSFKQWPQKGAGSVLP